MSLVQPCRLLEQESRGHLELCREFYPVEVARLRRFGDNLPQLTVLLGIPLCLWWVYEVAAWKRQPDQGCELSRSHDTVRNSGQFGRWNEMGVMEAVTRLNDPAACEPIHVQESRLRSVMDEVTLHKAVPIQLNIYVLLALDIGRHDQNK